MDFRDLPDGRLRATAQQRDHAAAILREAVVDGRLNVEELNARLPTALNAFTREDLANTADGTDTITLKRTVENVKSVTPQLPLTGGAGIGIIAALGALIVGAGAWWAKRAGNRA